MILSILTLYEHYPDLFDDMSIPTGMDKTRQIETICAELAELDVLYTDPAMLKTLIRIWSSRQLESWTKLFATTQFTYDPIANVDATETREYQYGKTETRTPNLSTTRTPNITHTRTANLTDTSTPGRVITEAVQGYDSTTWADARKQTESGSSTTGTSGTDTYTDTGTDTTSETGTDTKADSGKDTETVTRKGNIGVTMTQQLIEAERKVDQFDMYLYIADAFKQQFCLMVY